METLQALGAELAPAELVFVIGQDAFVDLDSWRQPELLPTLADFAVVTRPPGGGNLPDWLPSSLAASCEIATDGQSARHRETGRWIRRLTISALDVSATDVRSRLREGRSVRYLVPDAAREAVEKSLAYRATPEPERANDSA